MFVIKINQRVMFYPATDAAGHYQTFYAGIDNSCPTCPLDDKAFLETYPPKLFGERYAGDYFYSIQEGTPWYGRDSWPNKIRVMASAITEAYLICEYKC